MTTLVQQVRERLHRSRTRLTLRLASQPRPLSRSAALDDLSKTPSILFLCLGNICRSPLAERYARKQFESSSIDDFGVSSAGHHPKEGRPSPEPAIEVARRFGVDLEPHRSQRLTEAILTRADIVVVMDTQNYCWLRRNTPQALPVTYFLKPFGPGDGWDFAIQDPASGDVEMFRTVYDDIATAVDGIVDGLEQR